MENNVNKSATGIGKKFLNLFSAKNKPVTVVNKEQKAPIEQKVENKTTNASRLRFKQNNLQGISNVNVQAGGEQ